jgi:Protein of unknown function (DUF2004)
MSKFNSKYFGEIDLKTPKEFYELDMDFKGRTVEMVINSELLELKESEILWIETFLDNIATQEKELWDIVLEDFKKKGITKEYIDIVIDEIDKEDIDDLIREANKSLKRKEKILSVLYLITINFYPREDDKSFVILDYTIDEESTNELLVVVLNRDNGVDIKVES